MHLTGREPAALIPEDIHDRTFQLAHRPPGHRSPHALAAPTWARAYLVWRGGGRRGGWAPSSPRRSSDSRGRPLRLPPLELIDLVPLDVDDLLRKSGALGLRAVLELGVGHVDG